ncbi:hypothetical protein TeGR_g10218 [Tetraparma gracilis]|uniref:Tyrosine specific protein phosphatases domain-containing protein n=1 Tax=Tetraparma gracilis TaxID=2962635 RepID=A0ABQ6M8S7_9STRA|nr:hypothetical protein TeGR_g10218 [Tetraparma gracilis]
MPPETPPSTTPPSSFPAPTFSSVKNVRDLSSVPGSPILPNRLYRAGMPSDSCASDVSLLTAQPPLGLGVTTLIDLRSATELAADPRLSTSPAYSPYTSIKWSSKRTLRESLPPRLKIPDPSLPRLDRATGLPRRERHFVSLMDEKRYVAGTLQRLTKTSLAKLAAAAPGAIVSRRARARGKKVFLDRINNGGLPLLNDLILQMAAKGIRYVLELCADPSRHPVAFYCTAGKDRTGIVAAVILAYLGTPAEAVVGDYSLSDGVYKEMGDDSAMVGALKQRDLDPDVFLKAPPEVMRQTLREIGEHYGSVEAYLDFIGFGEEDRQRLRKALVEER